VSNLNVTHLDLDDLDLPPSQVEVEVSFTGPVACARTPSQPGLEPGVFKSLEVNKWNLGHVTP
jgi:hypothetical protein